MALAGKLSQVEGLLEEAIEEYPEEAASVEGILGQVREALSSAREGGEAEEPTEEEAPPVEEKPQFKDFGEAKEAAMETHRRTGNFRGEKEPKTSDEEEQAPESEEEKRKKKSKAVPPFGR